MTNSISLSWFRPLITEEHFLLITAEHCCFKETSDDEQGTVAQKSIEHLIWNGHLNTFRILTLVLTEEFSFLSSFY